MELARVLCGISSCLIGEVGRGQSTDSPHIFPFIDRSAACRRYIVRRWTPDFFEVARWGVGEATNCLPPSPTDDPTMRLTLTMTINMLMFGEMLGPSRRHVTRSIEARFFSFIYFWKKKLALICFKQQRHSGMFATVRRFFWRVHQTLIIRRLSIIAAVVNSPSLFTSGPGHCGLSAACSR